jgi:hypothetical protein
MAGLIAMIAIMMILSTVAFQAWEDVLRRDNEAEMIFRAEEIARAIQRYRQDHNGAGPPSLEMLAEPGPRGQYYLRHKYRDPLVKDGVWGLLFEGPDGSILDPSQVSPERNLGFDQGDAFGGRDGRPGQERGEEQQQQQQGDGLDWNDGLEANRNPQQRQGRHIQAGGQLIAGVKSLATGDPFRVHKGRDAYSQWLFTYQDFLFQPPAQQQVTPLDGPDGGRPDMRRRLGDNSGSSGRRQ